MGIKGEVVLESPRSAMSDKDSLDYDHISGSRILYQVPSQMNCEVFWNFSLFELIWGFLDFYLLIGDELGVSWQKCQFPTDFVLDADL